MQEKKRLSQIDLLESIAIFFVVLYHSTIYSFDIVGSDGIADYVLYFARTILSTCVPLFFFVNGYLLFNRDFDLKKHVKKMLRIVILIPIWALILMPLYMMAAGERFDIKTAVASILNLDTLWSMNLFWFLGALVCIYVLFPALKSLFDTSKKGFAVFTATCAILTFGFVLGNQVLSVLGTVLHRNEVGMNYPALTMFNPFRGSYGYSFVYFCVGGLICVYEDKIRSVRRTKRNVISILAILLSCGCLFAFGVFHTKCVNGRVWDVVWNGYDTVFTFINVLSIYTLSLNYSGESRFIKVVSCNTLGIYFTHGLVIRLTRPWIIKCGVLCNLPVNIVYSFLITCACLLACLIIRKIPLLKKMI